MTYGELWQKLLAESCPDGQPRIIPAKPGEQNATVSPLSVEGEALWQLAVYTEPFPVDDACRQWYEGVIADKQYDATKQRELLEYAVNHYRGQLLSLWWDGRQCFWRKVEDAFAVVVSKLHHARTNIGTAQAMLSERGF